MPPRSCSPRRGRRPLPTSNRRVLPEGNRVEVGPRPDRPVGDSACLQRRDPVAGARREGRRTDLRTRLAELAAGIVRLRLASIAVAAIALAVAAVDGARAALEQAEQVTVVVFAGALAM